MTTKYASLITILFLTFLNGCALVSQKDPPFTPEDVTLPSVNSTRENGTSFPTTTPTPDLLLSGIFELTVSIRDEAFHAHVYNVKIGCLDSVPCVVETKKLFDRKSSVSGLNWSPDGQSLVFESIENGSFDIFITSDEGKTVENITKTQELDEGSPNWIPDGTKFVFSVASRFEPTKLLLSSPDGRNIEQVLGDIFEPIQLTWSNQGMMAYSAFVSAQDIRYQIRVLNKDATLYWTVPLDESKMNFGTVDPVFSPNGKRLVYIGSWLNNNRIYVADLDAKTTQSLSSYSMDCNEFDPSWSTDGNWIVFTSNCEEENNGEYQIYLINVPERQRINLNIGLKGAIDDVVWRP